jgi:hypothetical protein
MRFFLLITGMALLTSCGSIDATWLWTGIRASDQAEIRTAARSITNSPIVSWQIDDRQHPREIFFSTKDGKVYAAERIGGKWQIHVPIFVVLKYDLTNRSSQPLHGANNFKMKTSTLKFAAQLAVVSGG